MHTRGILALTSLSLAVIISLPKFAFAQNQIPDQLPPPLITQIKIADDNPNDEYIEIYNPLPEEMPLAGFSLIKQTQSGREYLIYSFDDEILHPYSFFLLANNQGKFIEQGDIGYAISLASNNTLILRRDDDTEYENISWGNLDTAEFADPETDQCLSRTWDKESQIFTDMVLTICEQSRNSSSIWPPEDDEIASVPEENETQENTAYSIVINELSINPVENDVQWIELFNDSHEIIDITSWKISNQTELLVSIDGLIYPGQYLVFYWNELIIQNKDMVVLSDQTGTMVDTWDIDVALNSGQTLIWENEQLQITDLPTAARPNVLYDYTPPLCAQTDDQTESASEDVEINTPQNINAPTPQSGNVRINELYANPVGDEASQEFIELYNNENRAINLFNWTVSDNAKTYTFPDIIISAHGYLVLSRSISSIALNNTSESVKITDPFNTVLQTIDYSSTTEGLSYNFQPIDLWYEAEISPGAMNVPIPPQNNNDIIADTDAENNQSQTSQVSNKSVEDAKTNTNDNSTDIKSETIITDANLTQIKLNELLPNPEGSDDNEWIELYNPTEKSVSLRGLSIKDPTKTFEFTDEIIQANGYFLLNREQSQIALNNSGDEISLVLDQTIIDQFIYEESSENTSWARAQNNQWEQTTTLTPEEENEFQEKQPESTSTTATTTTKQSVPKTTKATATTKTIQIDTVDFESWKSVPNGQAVIINGILTVLPSTFNQRTAILQSLDSDPPLAIELYFHNAGWPNLKTGQILSIQGEKSVTKSGDRLLIRQTQDIAIKESAELSPYPFERLNSLDVSMNLLLVQTTGALVEQTKSQLVLGLGSDELPIDLKPAGIVLDKFEGIDSITVTGIIKQIKGQWVLWPRENQDIKSIALLKTDPTETVVSLIPTTTITEQTSQANYTLLLLFAGILAGGLACAVIIYRELVIQKAKSLQLFITKRIQLWIKHIPHRQKTESSKN